MEIPNKIKSNQIISGVATGWSRGAECALWQPKICLNREEEKSGKSGKYWERRKNHGEKAKIGKVLSHFAPLDQ